MVNTLSDNSSSGDGYCSLREAIDNANSPGTDTTDGDCGIGTGTDNVTFNVSGTITIGASLPAIAKNLTINGQGQNVAVDGSSLYGLMVIRSGATLNLNTLTIAHSYGNEHSGGIYNSGGTLNVTNSTLANYSNRRGCAIVNYGGIATVSSSTFSGNASGDGCGISNVANGTLSVNNSSFSGNQANEFQGGAIFLDSGIVSVSNSTFLYNSATSGADIYQRGGSITLTNSILGNSSAGGNCFGTVTDGGYNISDDTTCGFDTSTGATGQTIGDNVNPLLDPNGLQNNGGPTQTIALLSNSPAISAIPPAQCPATDQRGASRPATGQNACDIGAFEGSIPAPTPSPFADFYQPVVSVVAAGFWR
jgi:CSLREA domain-containing protein